MHFFKNIFFEGSLLVGNISPSETSYSVSTSSNAPLVGESNIHSLHSCQSPVQAVLCFFVIFFILPVRFQ